MAGWCFSWGAPIFLKACSVKKKTSPMWISDIWYLFELILGLPWGCGVTTNFCCLQPGVLLSVGRALQAVQATCPGWFLMEHPQDTVGGRNLAPPTEWLKAFKQWDKPSISWCRISQPSTVWMIHGVPPWLRKPTYHEYNQWCCRLDRNHVQSEKMIFWA